MNDREESLWLKFTLLSDTTFGRGDGVAGLVDAEVQHDSHGLPYLGGKTVKGLLAAECAEILYALQQANCSNIEKWERAARFLFGGPGSQIEQTGQMLVGNAQLPQDLRDLIASDFRLLDELEKELREKKIGQKRRQTLDSLTALRWQTAMDQITGAPKEKTLRTIRTIIRGVTFETHLRFASPVPQEAYWLLAACVKVFHRAGTNRNRGYGRLQASLYYKSLLAESNSSMDPTTWFEAFSTEIQK